MKPGISLALFAAANVALGVTCHGLSGSSPALAPSQSPNSSGHAASGGSSRFEPFNSHDSSVEYQVVDLSPAGYRQSCAVGIFGDRIVGWAIPAAQQGNLHHPMLWSGAEHKPTDLSSSTFIDSAGYGVAYTQTVGCGVSLASDPCTHAFLWNSDSEKSIDLNPPGFIMSAAEGVSGGKQIGYGLIPTGVPHALLWNSSAQNVVDLNPKLFLWSFAYGIWGNSEAGYGKTVGGDTHALLWRSTPQSAMDLNPRKFVQSWAVGICRNQEVGYGEILPDRSVHALLWTGTPASCIDLNPKGFLQSAAIATNGAMQVGRGMPVDSENWHALIWGSQAFIITDLSQYLPKGFTNSQAVGIDDAGNIVGDAVDSQHHMHTIEWVFQAGNFTLPE